jgi:hypothetical protein
MQEEPAVEALIRIELPIDYTNTPGDITFVHQHLHLSIS